MKALLLTVALLLGCVTVSSQDKDNYRLYKRSEYGLFDLSG